MKGTYAADNYGWIKPGDLIAYSSYNGKGCGIRDKSMAHPFQWFRADGGSYITINADDIALALAVEPLKHLRMNDVYVFFSRGGVQFVGWIIADMMKKL